MKTATCSILITAEDEGGYSVPVPALPGCFTEGETMEEVMLMAKEAVNLYLDSMEVTVPALILIPIFN